MIQPLYQIGETVKTPYASDLVDVTIMDIFLGRNGFVYVVQYGDETQPVAEEYLYKKWDDTK